MTGEQLRAAEAFHARPQRRHLRLVLGSDHRRFRLGPGLYRLGLLPGRLELARRHRDHRGEL